MPFGSAKDTPSAVRHLFHFTFKSAPDLNDEHLDDQMTWTHRSVFLMSDIPLKMDLLYLGIGLNAPQCRSRGHRSETQESPYATNTLNTGILRGRIREQDKIPAFTSHNLYIPKYQFARPPRFRVI